LGDQERSLFTENRKKTESGEVGVKLTVTFK